MKRPGHAYSTNERSMEGGVRSYASGSSSYPGQDHEARQDTWKKHGSFSGCSNLGTHKYTSFASRACCKLIDEVVCTQPAQKPVQRCGAMMSEQAMSALQLCQSGV